MSSDEEEEEGAGAKEEAPNNAQEAPERQLASEAAEAHAPSATALEPMSCILGPNEFEEHLLMDDYDIDDLLECDDIEMTPFMSSSKQLMSVIDNVINCLDEKINAKRFPANDDQPLTASYYQAHRTDNAGYDKTRKISVLY